MKNVIYAPETYCTLGDAEASGPLVFLAGSIEMGDAPDWQDDMVTEFKNKRVTFLNPRRKDWNSSWIQSIENKEFKKQVEWELLGLEQCDILFMYFDSNSKAPISLLELGLFARSSKLTNRLTNKTAIVYCPEGFWKKGNVDIVCDRYGIVCFDNLDKAKAVLEANIIVHNGVYNV